MFRSALTVVALTTFAFLSSTVVAQQAKPATPAPAAPAAKTRFVPPVRGTAVINMLQPVTKVVKDEVITHLKVKNMSQGSIALLRIDEYWYDKKGQMLPGDSQRIKKPIMPGEIIEIELRVPKNPAFYQNQYKFSHANGNIDAKLVKKFE
jgi:hypothetical protein